MSRARSRSRTKTRVTKATVLSALETEPLAFGIGFLDHQDIDNKACGVCAVGAVVRRAGVKNVGGPSPFSEVCRTACGQQYSFHETASAGNWLGALSIFWEYLHNSDKNPGLTVPEARRLTMDWWRAHCPTDWFTYLDPGL